MPPPIRVLSIMEAAFVTGPSKNLIEFACQARSETAGLPALEFTFATYERPGQGENRFLVAAAAAGIPIGVIQEKHAFDRAVLPQLFALLEARKPDIVQTHNVKSAFLMRWSGANRRQPWIAFQHGYVTTDLRMRCYNQIDRWSLPAADHVVTVCQKFADDLVARGVRRERISVQHNAVREFSPIGSEPVEALRRSLPAGGAGGKVLITIGRLSQEKGQVDLVRALGRLRRQWPDDRFHAVLVGEGPERQRIEAARAQEGLQEHVTLAGLQHDVRPYFALADLVVIPSHTEGSPNVLLEAMVAARPIVATRAGGIPEIAVDGETADLVPIRDSAALAQAIHRMLHDPGRGRQMAARAQRVALLDYSPEAYRRSLGALYPRVLAARPVRKDS